MLAALGASALCSRLHAAFFFLKKKQKHAATMPTSMTSRRVVPNREPARPCADTRKDGIGAMPTTQRLCYVLVLSAAVNFFARAPPPRATGAARESCTALWGFRSAEAASPRAYVYSQSHLPSLVTAPTSSLRRLQKKRRDNVDLRLRGRGAPWLEKIVAIFSFASRLGPKDLYSRPLGCLFWMG